MPELTVVVLVRSARRPVRAGLESVARQMSETTEMVVVDHTASGADRLVDALGTPGDGLQIVRVPRDRGAAAARKAGLDAASGEHVVFVDGDDLVADGALAAIARRIAATDADVLVFALGVVSPNGRRRRQELDLRWAASEPAAFSVVDRPEALALARPAWNKAYRRTLLQATRSDEQGPGDDGAWSLRAVLAAERISVLDLVCCYQRSDPQRPSQQRRRAVDELIAEYTRVFAFLDSRPDLEARRAPLHARMTAELIRAFSGRGKRMAPLRRVKLFQKASQLVRSTRPRRARLDGVDISRLDLLALTRGWYRVFVVLERTAGIRRRARRAREVAATAAPVPGQFVRGRVHRAVYRMALRAPMDANLAVFAAYWNRGFTCNPRAIYEKLAELSPDVRGVWVIRRSKAEVLPAGVPHVYPDTVRYWWALGRAKYLINNVNFPNEVRKRPGSIHVQTQHGTPLKLMGLDLKGRDSRTSLDFEKLRDRVGRWNYNVSANRFSTEVWQRCFPGDYETLEYGYPRNDVLVTATEADVARVRGELGLDPDATVILYAPTFREDQEWFKPPFDLGRFCRALPPNHVLLVRGHYFYTRARALRGLAEAGALVDVSRHPVVEDLCIAADVLITDYSSIQFDYANLNRPIVIYANDWERYGRQRGVNFDLLAEPPGLVATTEDELISAFTEGTYDTPQTREQLCRYRWRFCEFEDGGAAERIVRKVFLGAEVEPPVPLQQREQGSALSTLRG